MPLMTPCSSAHYWLAHALKPITPDQAERPHRQQRQKETDNQEPGIEPNDSGIDLRCRLGQLGVLEVSEELNDLFIVERPRPEHALHRREVRILKNSDKLGILVFGVDRSQVRTEGSTAEPGHSVYVMTRDAGTAPTLQRYAAGEQLESTIDVGWNDGSRQLR